jgi:hypothetical protein
VSYAVGSVVRLPATFRDATGALYSPTTVTATVTKPDGASTTSSPITADSLGIYHYDYTTTTLPGLYPHYFSGTGGGVAVQIPDVFCIVPLTSRALVGLGEVKSTLRIPVTTLTYDSDLIDWIAAATPIIEDIVGPVLTSQESRTYDGGDTAVLLPSAATSIVSVVENGVTITDYTPNLQSGIIFKGQPLAPMPFFPGRQNIVVTYMVGSGNVDPNIREATKELIRVWWQIGQQANRPGFGDQVEPDAWTPSGFAVTRRVIELCAPNARVPGFA